MRLFFVALQFLTRIHIVKQDSWTAEDFGRSTRFFPLVGLVQGVIYLIFAWVLLALLGQSAFFASLMLILTIIITGGLHYDGFMDTMDGLFSARNRECMLKIMKDSRVGSYGALSAICLILLQWSLLRDIDTDFIMMALYIMPIIGRMGMVLVIASFPYARPEGLGKAFAEMTDKKTLIVAGSTTIAAIIPLGIVAEASLIAGLLAAYLFGRYSASKLGGVTGDVYGAAELLAETAVMGTLCVLGSNFYDLCQACLEILRCNFGY